MAQNGAESVPIDMQVSYLKKDVINRVKKHLFMRKDIAMTRGLLSKVFSSNTLRSLIDRCFRDVLSVFRFEDKFDNS